MSTTAAGGRTTSELLAGLELRDDGQWPCPLCERAFRFKQGVGMHLVKSHGATPDSKSAKLHARKRAEQESLDLAVEEEDGDSPLVRVNTELRTITAPLREQRAQIEKDLIALQRQMNHLREAKRRIDQVLKSIDPKQATVKAGVNPEVADVKKRREVEAYLKEHKAELDEGFTASELARRVKENGSGVAISPEKMRKIFEELRDAGTIRADRIVKGGGMLYRMN